VKYRDRIKDFCRVSTPPAVPVLQTWQKATPCYAGVDLATTSDMAAVVFGFKSDGSVTLVEPTR